MTTESSVYNRARDIALIAGGVILLIIGARIAFELPAVSLGRFYVPDNPYVPITLQTFGVLFTSAALGARRGFSATSIYLLIGAAGLPVFASEGSGTATFASFDSGSVVMRPRWPRRAARGAATSPCRCERRGP